MKAVLAMMDLGRRGAVGDRDPIRNWHKGRGMGGLAAGRDNPASARLG